MTIDALIDSGAPLNLQDVQGRTPLMVAARGGDTTIVQRLLDLGADPQLRDRAGRTAAMIATGEARHLLQPSLHVAEVPPVDGASIQLEEQSASDEAKVAMSQTSSVLLKIAENDAATTATTSASSGEQADELGMMPTPTTATRPKYRSCASSGTESKVSMLPSLLDCDDMQAAPSMMSKKSSKRPKSPSRRSRPPKTMDSKLSMTKSASTLASSGTKSGASKVGRKQTTERQKSFDTAVTASEANDTI